MNNDPKQVIILRKDLKIRKGKMIAQGAHASLKVFLDWKHSHINPHFDPVSREWRMRFLTPEMIEWLKGSFVKICVGVNNEEGLLEVYNKAKKAGLPCSLVRDSGRTEFKGLPTYTAVAIGPANPDDVDEITGKLKLL